MMMLVMVLALLAISIAAWGQPDTREAPSRQAPPRGAVTFAELEGSVIETRVVLQQVIQREGKEVAVRVEHDLRLTIGSGSRIDWTWTPTAYGPRGVRRGETRTFSNLLERPGETDLFGGSHGVWVFDKGTLTGLRTFKNGAFKSDTVFARDAEGLTCTASATFAREGGTGSITLDNAIDGVQVTVVSAKQISSSCRVTKASPRAEGLQK